MFYLSNYLFIVLSNLFFYFNFKESDDDDGDDNEVDSMSPLKLPAKRLEHDGDNGEDYFETESISALKSPTSSSSSPELLDGPTASDKSVTTEHLSTAVIEVPGKFIPFTPATEYYIKCKMICI